MPMMGSKVLAATPNQGASTVYFAKDINAENFLAIYDRLKKDGNLPDDGRLTESNFTATMSIRIERCGKRC